MNEQFKNEPTNFIDSNKVYYCGSNIKATGFTLLMKYVLIFDEKQIAYYLDSIKNVSQIINQSNSIGWSALMIAIFNTTKSKNINIVKCLLNYKANVNHKSNYNDTPIIITSLKRHCRYDILKLLIDNSADVNAVEHNNCNAFHNIFGSLQDSTENNLNCIELLLKHGCNPFYDLKNKLNFAPLKGLHIIEHITKLWQMITTYSFPLFAEQNIVDIFSHYIKPYHDAGLSLEYIFGYMVKYIKPIHVIEINEIYCKLYFEGKYNKILELLFANNLADKYIIASHYSRYSISNVDTINILLKNNILIAYINTTIMTCFFNQLTENINTEQIYYNLQSNYNVPFNERDRVFEFCCVKSNTKYGRVLMESMLNYLDNINYYCKYKLIVENRIKPAIIGYIEKRETNIKMIKKKFKFTPKCNILENNNIVFTLLLITKFVAPFKYNNDIIKKIIIPLLYSCY